MATVQNTLKYIYSDWTSLKQALSHPCLHSLVEVLDAPRPDIYPEIRGRSIEDTFQQGLILNIES